MTGVQTCALPISENAVDEVDLTTGQALMSVVTVPKETEFLGVVTLRDPTPEMEIGRASCRERV